MLSEMVSAMLHRLLLLCPVVSLLWSESPMGHSPSSMSLPQCGSPVGCRPSEMEMPLGGDSPSPAPCGCQFLSHICLDRGIQCSSGWDFGT